MRSFIFRAVNREPNGRIGPTLHERTITADDVIEAIVQAKLIEIDMAEIGANAFYLSTESGRAVWSLHVPPAKDVHP